MKKTLVKLFAGAAFAAAGVGLVGAGVAVAHPGGPRMGRIAQFDKNGDGQLDAQEREAMRAAHQARRAEMLQKFDANHDGTIDDAERDTARKTFMAERFKALDTNGDGQLSFDEFVAGAGQHRGFRKGR
jgi:Ca2+-binding EF-hand superfamily protein